jgi:P-type Cu+ transporter
VFAATRARLGGLRIRATHVAEDTTFGRIVKMVEEAEAHRAEVQRLADRFSAYYLPVVVGLAVNGMSPDDVLAAAASAERYSEHPLAEATRAAAREHGIPLREPEDFEAIPGRGVRARVNGHLVAVLANSSRLLRQR